MRRAIIGAVILSASAALASDWDIDTAHSSTGFTVRHMMISNVHGAFGKTTGTVHLDDKDVTKSSIDATIDVASIDTRDEKRDGHLKSPDFFDAQKFPTITFKSTKVAKAGKDKLKVTGDLTMHGITKPVTLDVTFDPTPRKDPFMNAEHRGATATATINRKDWGLTWNKALEGGGVLVGEDVKLQLDVELVKKTEPAAAKQG